MSLNLARESNQIDYLDLKNGLYKSVPTVDISKMIKPVRCLHCGEIYDLCDANRNHRYQDCDQFTTPCCGYKFADTRLHKSFPDYEEL